MVKQLRKTTYKMSKLYFLIYYFLYYIIKIIYFFKKKFYFQKLPLHKGAGEMAQLLRELATLPEDPQHPQYGLLPSPRGSDPLPGTHMVPRHICKQKTAYIQNK